MSADVCIEIMIYRFFCFLVSLFLHCRSVLLSIIRQEVKKEKEQDKRRVESLDDYVFRLLNRYPLASAKSSNISSDMLDSQLYEMLKCGKHPIETQWLSRILVESTPQGVVAMSFNLYRFGFAYYADGEISRKVLEAVAQKYVWMFHARELYGDTQARRAFAKTVGTNDEGMKEKKKMVLGLEEDVFVTGKKAYPRRVKEGKKEERVKETEKEEEKKQDKTVIFIKSGKFRDAPLMQKLPMSKTRKTSYMQFKQNSSSLSVVSSG